MKHQTWTPRAENFWRLEENQTYWGRKKIAGKDHKQCFGPNREAAKAELHNWLASLLKNGPQPKEAGDLTLADTAPKFIAWKQKDVGDTIRQYSVDKLEETLGFVSSYWPGYSKIPVCRLARSDMETMRADLKQGISKRTGEHLKAATVNTYCATVKRLLKYLTEEAKLLTLGQFADLAKGIRYSKRTARMIEIPTPDQLAIMRSYLRRHIYGKGRKRKQIPYMADMLFLYGVRIDMLRKLKVKHIDFARKIITFTVNKQPLGSPELGELPLLPEAELLLRGYIQLMGLGPDDFLFTLKTIHRSLKKAASLAGLSNWYHHACRKFVATKLIQDGVDVPTVAEFLFHKDHGKTLLEHYRMACGRHLREVGAKIKMLPGVDVQIPEWIALTKPLIQKAIEHIFAAEAEVAKPILEAVLDIGNSLHCGDARKALARLNPAVGTHLHRDWSQASPHFTTHNQDQSRKVVSENLRYLVLSRGLSISEASQGSAVPKYILYDLLSCKYSGTSYFIDKLARHFELPSEYFFDPKQPRVDAARIIKNFRFLADRFGHASLALPSLIGKVVTGLILPPGDLVRKLASLVGVTIHELMTEDISQIPLVEPKPVPPKRPTLDRKAALPHLAANLQYHLMLGGLIPTEASRLMGMNSYDLPRYAAGKNFPVGNKLETIATFFHTTPEALCAPPPDLDPVQIGLNISQLIDQKRMTPNAVAVASNIYPERLRETLTGKKLPSSHQLKRLSGFFGVSTKDIITLKNQEILTMQQNATASLKPLPAAGEQPVSEL
jgi:integrase